MLPVDAICLIFLGLHLPHTLLPHTWGTYDERTQKDHRRLGKMRLLFLFVSSDVLFFPFSVHRAHTTKKQKQSEFICALTAFCRIFSSSHRIVLLVFFRSLRYVSSSMRSVFSFILFCVHCLAKHLPKIHSCINNNAYNILLCYVNNGRVRVSSVCLCLYLRNILEVSVFHFIFHLRNKPSEHIKATTVNQYRHLAYQRKFSVVHAWWYPESDTQAAQAHVYTTMFIHYTIIRSKRI